MILVSYRIVGEEQRQTRTFDTEQEAKEYIKELMQSPALDDQFEPVRMWVPKKDNQ